MQLTAMPVQARPWRPWTAGARGLGRLLGGLCLLAALLSTAVPAAVGLAGDQLLVVISGSMTPTFRAGDAVLVTHPHESQLRTGMIVSFHAPGQPQRLTTHRIHSLRPRPEGLFIQTKGDANAAPDPDFTPAGSVVGVMAHAFPKAGRWLSLAQAPVGKLLLLGLPLTLLLVGQLASLRRMRRHSTGGGGAGRLALVIGAGMLAVGGGVVAAHATGATFTATASAASNRFTTRTFCSSASGYRARVLADAPSLFYRLGEASGTTAADAAATPHNGTFQGSPALGQDGAIRCDTNDAVLFDGVNDYVSNAYKATAPSAFTLELWFKTTTGGGKLIGFGNALTGASSSYDRHIYLTDNGQLVFGVYPGAVRTIVSPSTYLDNQWHQVTASLGTAGMRLYVDGSQVASDTATTTAESNTGYWRVGYDNLASWGATTPTNYFFKGLIDEVAVYPTQLSATSVAAHFNANAA